MFHNAVRSIIKLICLDYLIHPLSPFHKQPQPLSKGSCFCCIKQTNKSLKGEGGEKNYRYQSLWEYVCSWKWQQEAHGPHRSPEILHWLLVTRVNICIAYQQAHQLINKSQIIIWSLTSINYLAPGPFVLWLLFLADEFC